MSKVDLKLSYGRDGETYHGVIFSGDEPEKVFSGLQVNEPFEGLTFARMMSRLAAHIRSAPVEVPLVVTLSRIEMADSSYVLDKPTVDLLRTDPAAAIRSMTHENRVVYVRDPGKCEEPAQGFLRAGHDTLADAFGDRAYCQIDKDGRVECIGCGRWHTHAVTAVRCSRCHTMVCGERHGKWFVVRTAAVLNLERTRYYLPRAWNPSRGWITHDALHSMFDAFNEERDNV